MSTRRLQCGRSVPDAWRVQAQAATEIGRSARRPVLTCGLLGVSLGFSRRARGATHNANYRDSFSTRSRSPRPSSCTTRNGGGRADMEILTTIAIGRHTIDFGVATTHEEREAVLAQRFRVYQREGYYLDGVVEDRDEHDEHAVFFLAQLRRTPPTKGVMVGSARLIRGLEDPTFNFPCQKGHRFELPDPVRGALSTALPHRRHGSRCGGATTAGAHARAHTARFRRPKSA